jgi:hypothetical protein
MRYQTLLSSSGGVFNRGHAARLIASEGASRTLRMLSLSKRREDELTGFFTILLEVHPELGISPILIGASTQVLRNIPAGKEVTIAGLEG